MTDYFANRHEAVQVRRCEYELPCPPRPDVGSSGADSWVFRDVVFQDVGFQNIIFKNPHPPHPYQL